MNKKTFILTGILSLLIIASFVYAATLISITKVKTCTDSDGGVNVDVKGTTSGLFLNGNAYNRTDLCLGGNTTTLIEYACKTVNTTRYLETWMQDCMQLNKTCSGGRCI